MNILLSFGSKHMLVLVSYDVETKNLQGQRRLRKISRICLKYGIRVQNSVFECHVNASQKITLTQEILSVADLTCDSIRIYEMGNRYKGRVEHYGIKSTDDVKSDVIIV
jgi:CRISPR-associated protein Cas2